MTTKVSTHLEPWHNLTGKIVMVTGASSGLGREFSLDLAKAGCRIIVTARRINRLKSLCDEINQLDIIDAAEPTSLRVAAVELDISAGGDSIQKSVEKAWSAFGRIDAVINNAGARGNVRNPLELSEEEWHHEIRTNLTGTWLVSKYVCKLMRDINQRGSVINISSAAGTDRGQLPGAVAYASSKTGLNAVTKLMALELGVHKIRVNSISPGLFKSEITEALMQKDRITNVALKAYPLRTFGTIDPALTSVIRYLIHDMSEYVSGNIFIVDAGATLPGVPIFSSL